MSDDQQAKTDPWQRALGPVRHAERPARRPRPGPGRHRPATHRNDPWQRALTGPPISEPTSAS